MRRSLSQRILRWLARRGAGRIQVRAVALVAVSLVVFVVVMVAADLMSSRRIIERELEQQTEATARMIAVIAGDKLSTGVLTDMARTTISLARIGNLARIEIHDRRSGATLEADAGRFLLRSQFNNPLARAALANGQVMFHNAQDHVEVAVPIFVQDAIRGVVLVASTDDFQIQKRREAILRSLVIAIVFLAVLLPLMSVLVGRLLAPVRELTEATRRIARGELDVPVRARSGGELGELAASFHRMTKRLKASIEVERRLAYTDPVTGLANRERLRRGVENAAEAARIDGRPRALFFIDLDGFKRVNDVFGHETGDKLLIAVARRFESVLREQGWVLIDPMTAPLLQDRIDRPALLGRHGGDEFVIGVRFRSDARAEAAALAARLLSTLREPFDIDGQIIVVGASVGIACMPDDGGDASTLMRHADLAMYQAKEAGRNRYCFFSSEMSQKLIDRLVLEMELRRAIGNDEIDAFYMPQVDLKTGRICAFEALARWRHPTKGLLQPAQFIPLAEESGMIADIDKAVMRKALRQASDWAWKGTTIPVAVNMSPEDFARPEMITFVARLLKEYGVPGNLLEIEVTESAAMRDPDRAARVMSELKRSGVRFAIDDFGTGYSNLGQLLKLPVDVFKIDRSFVKSIEGNGEAHHLVRTIVGLADQMGLSTVAEGIETEEQAELLTRLGVHIGQGYFYGQPVPASEAEKLIERHYPHAAGGSWMV
jgi:predicted signal transduction protein with EAL and GGDEF domain